MRQPVQSGISSPRLAILDALAVIAETVKHKMADTIATLWPLSGKESPAIYPNPVSRGSVFHIVCPVVQGICRASLHDGNGVLISEKVIAMNGKGHIEEWQLPEGTAAGIYIVRMMMPDGTLGFTRDLVVE